MRFFNQYNHPFNSCNYYKYTIISSYSTALFAKTLHNYLILPLKKPHQGFMPNSYTLFTGSGMARANPGYNESEEENLTGARPKRPTMPLRLNHQPP
jgi:hypothetical protein